MIVLGLTNNQANALHNALLEWDYKYGSDDIIDTIIENLEEKLEE